VYFLRIWMLGILETHRFGAKANSGKTPIMLVKKMLVENDFMLVKKIVVENNFVEIWVM
jgi:hypothetical protein